MSIRLMTQVWDGGCYSGSTLLVLLAIADFASNDGRRIFPHVETLAEKARISTRAVQLALNVLIEDGVLSTDDRAGGRGKRVEYRMDVERVKNMRPTQKGEGDDEKARSARPQSPNLAPAKSENFDIAYKDEPSTEPSREPLSEPPLTAVAVCEAPSEIDLAVQAYNEGAEQCPKWTKCWKVTPPRKKAIAARLGDVGLDGWRRAVEIAAASGFLGGPMPTSGDHRDWRLDIAWFAKAENFTKIIEGKYAPARAAGHGRAIDTALEGIGDFLNGH